MAEKNKVSPFQQELIDAAKLILEYKADAESNIVAIFYKEPDELYNTNLSLSEFGNNIWRVYFEIAHGIIIEGKKKSLDDITVGMYLDQHKKLKAKYDEYGGYDTIAELTSYVKVENLYGYISDLRKWNAVAKLCKRGFPVKENLSDFADMSAEDIYNEYEAYLNDTFVNIDSDIKSYDICDGIEELIETLDKGSAIGLPYYGMKNLSDLTGGQYLGSITLLGGVSNAGKSTIARSTTIPSIIENNEKVVIMVNEDSLAKWQREMLVWVCNNELKFDIQKNVIRNGNYSNDVKEHLYKAAQWLRDHTANNMITIIPFIQYQTAKAIKEIKKYAALGVKYFILDTYKMDSGKVSPNAWLEMQQNMVDIKNVVKGEALNVHILITFQLEKGSSTTRYYTQNNIGMAKNIVDVASTCIMVRDLFPDEYTGEKNGLYVKNPLTDGSHVVVDLDKKKKYQLFFIVKNQEGAANSYQIVAEHDKSRNIIKEVGVTNVLPDF